MSLSTTSNSPLISVVAPVYKVEPFLQECIDSVLNQSFKDFELILVDDGSPDKCGEICDKAAEKDTRIRVFHQENGGVSSARKLGVDNAKGEWVCFVDADDRLLPNALQDLITACDTLGYNIDDFDIIEGAHKTFKVNEKTGKEQFFYSQRKITYPKEKDKFIIVDGLEYAKVMVAYNSCFSESPWRKLFRRSVLIRTDACNIPKEHVRGEDTILNIKMSTRIRQALKIQNVVYEYRINPHGSCSNNNHRFRTFASQSFWWDAIKEVLKDMSEEWQDVYKINVTRKFYPHFTADKGKTWHLRSPEFKPYLAIIQDKKDLLPTAAKICLLSTRFPFTLIPEWLFYMTFFGTKFIVMLPIRVVRKLWRIIRRQ